MMLRPVHALALGLLTFVLLISVFWFEDAAACAVVFRRFEVRAGLCLALAVGAVSMAVIRRADRQFWLTLGGALGLSGVGLKLLTPFFC
ncbi:hypothetical protein [Deinococcus sp. RM]|uniref:hypothetical protein n=1 Tax=Deinococcus sp. RM TaxID=2316359 RepID=UPI0011C21B58|nr:hypothetical protein [Deinococcus sp. RM]